METILMILLAPLLVILGPLVLLGPFAVLLPLWYLAMPVLILFGLI